MVKAYLKNKLFFFLPFVIINISYILSIFLYLILWNTHFSINKDIFIDFFSFYIFWELKVNFTFFHFIVIEEVFGLKAHCSFSFESFCAFIMVVDILRLVNFLGFLMILLNMHFLVFSSRRRDGLLVRLLVASGSLLVLKVENIVLGV